MEVSRKRAPLPPAVALGPVEPLIAQGRIAEALARIHVPSLLPRGRHAVKAPAVLVIATALEAAIRKEPRLGSFAAEVAAVAGLARSVGELRDDHARAPSKQLRHEIAALESRAVRELEHVLAAMTHALAQS